MKGLNEIKVRLSGGLLSAAFITALGFAAAGCEHYERPLEGAPQVEPPAPVAPDVLEDEGGEGDDEGEENEEGDADDGEDGADEEDGGDEGGEGGEGGPRLPSLNLKPNGNAVDPDRLVEVAAGHNNNFGGNAAAVAEAINDNDWDLSIIPDAPTARPAPDPTAATDSQPMAANQPPRSITAVLLKVRTGNIPKAETKTKGKFLFELCPTDNFEDRNCFRRRFSRTRNLTLETGAVETITFAGEPSAGQESVPGSKPLDNLHSDDVQYFRISSTDDKPVHDAWFLQGVKLEVSLERGNEPNGTNMVRVVYNNGCVGRWIVRDRGKCDNCDSPHSIENDIATCIYIETGGGENDGSNGRVFAIIPKIGDLKPSTQSWLRRYWPKFATPWFDSILINDLPRFSISLRYSGTDDFRRECGNTYTATLYDGRGSIDTRYLQIMTTSDDALKIHRVRAYSFRPGLSDFIERGACLYGEAVPPDYSLSSDPREGNQYWPDGGFLQLGHASCVD